MPRRRKRSGLLGSDTSLLNGLEHCEQGMMAHMFASSWQEVAPGIVSNR